MLKYGLKSNILHFKNTQKAERTARRPDPGRPSGTDKDILSQIHDAAEFPAGPADFPQRLFPASSGIVPRIIPRIIP